MKTGIIKIMLTAAVAMIAITSCTNPGRWPNATIPYMLVGFSEEEQATIVSSMWLWEQSTGVNFQNVLLEKHEEETNVLYILKSDEESDIDGISTCGYQDDKIHMTILSKVTQQIVVHEMGHVLGLTHEHQRPDRDGHILINWGNIVNNASIKSQFLTNEPKYYDYKKYKYDFFSCMHYGNKSGTRSNDLNTIESPVPVGIYDMPSRMDIKKVRKIQGTDNKLEVEL
jgi:hypothetical protein